MPLIVCADLTGRCDVTVEGATGRDVLLGCIGDADRQHRQDAIPLDAVMDAISGDRLHPSCGSRP